MNKNLIALAIELAALVCLSSALGCAETRSGNLVDSICWDSEEENINMKDTSIYVDRDRNMEVRFCSPKAKTRYFALVLPDGLNLKLDAEGNAKAAQLVQQIGKQSSLRVIINGETKKNTTRVDLISAAR